MSFSAMYEKIESLREEMVRSLVRLCRIPAFHPSSGGKGEAEKAKFLSSLIEDLGMEWKEYNAEDESVPSGYRPNLVVGYGNKGRKTWIVTHIDVVPPGDLKKWKCDPFDPVVENGKIYGRGVEDNGQDLIASLYALSVLKESNLNLERVIGLAFVSDEETGSQKGIKHLLKKKIFRKGDLIVTPDRGSPDGSEIEIAEKNLLWFRVTTEGRQAHGSLPHKGVNAFRAASRLICRIDETLHSKFNEENPLFQPPISTFEPTKRESNVQNINTIPGRDVFYFDCRMLPQYSPEEILGVVESLAEETEAEFGVKTRIEVVQKEKSPPTSQESEIAKRLRSSIKKALGIEPRFVGVGGGTCAAHFRKEGFEAVAWQTCDETAHEVNEYSRIDNLVKDSKVYLTLFFS